MQAAALQSTPASTAVIDIKLTAETDMSYIPKPYYYFNRKRQIIDRQVDELHTMQLDMIDQAVDASDLREAKEIIEWIRSK